MTAFIIGLLIPIVPLVIGEIYFTCTLDIGGRIIGAIVSLILCIIYIIILCLGII